MPDTIGNGTSTRKIFDQCNKRMHGQNTSLQNCQPISNNISICELQQSASTINRQTNRSYTYKYKNLQESTVLPHIVVNFNNLGPDQELHHHPRCDDGGDPKLHDSTTIGSEDHTHPIKRICARGGMNPIQRKLAAYQEDEEGDDSINNLLPEWNFPIGTLHLREKRKEWPDQMKDSKPTSHLPSTNLLSTTLHQNRWEKKKTQ